MHHGFRFVALVLVGIGAGSPVACTDAPTRRPDVLLVVVDTLRADHCSLHGYPRETTPVLDRLAAEGVTFDAAYTSTSSTCPSHASLFTSRFPLGHGVLRNGLPLSEDEITLAEQLSAAGWRTGAFVSSFPVSSRFGFAQGFDHFDDVFDPARSGFPFARWGGHEIGDDEGFDRPGKATTRAAIKWIESQRAGPEPLFVWTHYFDPHAPYTPRPGRTFTPGPEDTTGSLALYDGEIAYVDAELGRLVAAMESRDPERDLLLVFLGDHGEGLGDHGWGGHGRHVYDEEVRVPLVFRWPGQLPAGVRIASPVHVVDVLPTLTGMLGLDPVGPGGDGSATGREGVDLGLSMHAEVVLDRERPIFLQRPFHEGGRPDLGEIGFGFGLRSGRWKLVLADEEQRLELYDLEQDPGERNDLSALHPDVAQGLGDQLRGWVAEQRAAAVQRDIAMPEGALEGLRALGYVGYTDDG